MDSVMVGQLRQQGTEINRVQILLCLSNLLAGLKTLALFYGGCAPRWGFNHNFINSFRCLGGAGWMLADDKHFRFMRREIVFVAYRWSGRRVDIFPRCLGKDIDSFKLTLFCSIGKTSRYWDASYARWLEEIFVHGTCFWAPTYV